MNVKRFDCYYPNVFNNEYRAFSREESDGDWVKFEDYDALAARLALAREWIASQPHGSSLATGADCLKFHDHARACTCGRDALLKALELPR